MESRCNFASTKLLETRLCVSYVVVRSNISAIWLMLVIKSSGSLSDCLIKKHDSIPPLNSNGNIISDDKQNAELLNDFFASCWNSLEQPLTE